MLPIFARPVLYRTTFLLRFYQLISRPVLFSFRLIPLLKYMILWLVDLVLLSNAVQGITQRDELTYFAGNLHIGCLLCTVEN